MIAPLVLICVSMAAKDTLYTASTFFISRAKPLLASVFDVGGDISLVISVGVTSLVTIQHGFSGLTVLAFGAMAVGSFAGTFAGVRLATKLGERAGLKPHEVYR